MAIAFHRRRIADVDAGLELRQVGNEPRGAGDVVELRAPLLVDERRGLGQIALQLGLGLARHPRADEEHRRADREHRQQRAGQEDAIGDRAEHAHHGTTRSTSAHPAGGTTTARVVRGFALVPADERVGAGGHRRQVEAAVDVGDVEERVAEHEDKRVHVRVDVAEDADDARPVHAHRFRSAGGIAAEVEALRARQREHVVVRQVAVGEVDDGADHHGQHVRHEALVALVHDGAAGLAFVEGGARRGVEVDEPAAQVRDVARPRAARRGDIGPALGGLGEAADVEAAADAARQRVVRAGSVGLAALVDSLRSWDSHCVRRARCARREDRDSTRAIPRSAEGATPRGRASGRLPRASEASVPHRAEGEAPQNQYSTCAVTQRVGRDASAVAPVALPRALGEDVARDGVAAADLDPPGIGVPRVAPARPDDVAEVDAVAARRR